MTMDRQELKTQLQEIFHDVFDDDSIAITEEMTAKDVEAWDSLNHVRLIVSIEQELSLSFSTSDVADLRNVGELMDLIQRHLNKAA